MWCGQGKTGLCVYVLLLIAEERDIQTRLDYNKGVWKIVIKVAASCYLTRSVC